ncbi:hypothetical protein H2203_005867 [Taxawa tesnikishii (nom. ined.)]|nr:hypothetical protein H2203_005867 [Dothideales sp. JES 119]
MNYEDYMADDTNLSTALMQLQKFGLVFIRGLPDTEQAVVDVANRIGPLKNTFYGLTWNVRSVPNAKNVAYTHQDLGFHMDLLYMHQPPRLQLLHCLRASTSGGASLFTDAYRAVVKMLQNHRKEFDVLRSIDVNYHYDNDSQHYFQSRPVIQLKPDTPSDVLAPSGNDNPHAILPFIEAVNWSPPFQGPFGWKSGGNNALNKNVRAWHRAARIFRNLVEAKGAVYERQMAPGECVIFDNRRVLHARTAFKVDDIGKERWLKGAYLDWDPWVSKMRVLGRDVIAKKTASNVDPEDDGQPAKGEQDAQEDVNLDLAGLRTHFNEMGRRASNS